MDSFRYFYRDMAKEEAARRYYSVKELLMTGAKNVFSNPSTIPDKEFLDPTNTSYLYNNEPLRKLLENKYLKGFSLKTEPPEPRLLIVTVEMYRKVQQSHLIVILLKQNMITSIL